MRSIVINLITALLTFLLGVSIYSVRNINYQLIDIPPSQFSFGFYKEGHNHIQVLISSLSSEDERVRRGAEKELIVLGQHFPEQRKIVIRELLQSTEQRENLKTGRCFYLDTTIYYWSSVTNIFGELKADEAIDVLIKTIYCGNGMGGNESEEPSLDALIEMGAIAVPKLSAALLSEPYAYKRGQIIICLSYIGGRQAKVALKRALRSESNEDVIWSIKHSLSHWKES